MSDAKFTYWIKQLEAKVNELFAEYIDMSDYADRPQNNRKDAFNSRAIAAYALYALAEVNREVAAKAVVDGQDDNGIDALFFDKKQKTLWVIQAKWIHKGQGSPKADDLRSFRDGIFHLLDFDKKIDRFNHKFEAKESEITSAFNCGVNLKIKIVVAYTGSEFSRHARTVLNDCIEDLNEIKSGMASLEDFNLDRAFSALVASDKQDDIDVSFSLANWGIVEEPYKAFYGQISAIEVAKWWIQHKGRLFSRNIRDFIGESEVNSEIAKTIEQNPRLFWYFNNGITVLCKEITRDDIKVKRREGEFTAKGISIVNGAQTIGSIGAIYQNYAPDEREKLEEAEIFIRFISSEDFEEFGLQVTRATNTQNKVEVRDFVALDPQQDRLSREFRSGGRNYHYKRTSESFDRDEKNFDLEEATVALACAYDDISLAIAAKQELSKLWADTSQPPYTKIFRQEIPAIQIWRQIEVKRKVENYIKDKLTTSEDQLEVAILKYANLFILHILFKLSKRSVFYADTSESEFSDYKQFEIQKLISKILTLSQDYLTANGKSQKLWMFFNSPKKSNEIKSYIMQNT